MLGGGDKRRSTSIAIANRLSFLHEVKVLWVNWELGVFFSKMPQELEVVAKNLN